jgi:hypothetical protein
MTKTYTVGKSVFTESEMDDIVAAADDCMIEEEFHERGLDCGCDEYDPEPAEEPDVDLGMLIDGLASIKVGHIENGIRLLELGLGKSNTQICDASLVRVGKLPL